MEMKDPFFVVKSEVEKTIDLVNGLYASWKESSKEGGDEFQRLGDELRNNLRSIEWDLEDLEETIRVAEKNPGKFKLEPHDLMGRNTFVSNTRHLTQMVREEVEKPRKIAYNYELHRPSITQTKKSGHAGYTRLQEGEDDDYGGGGGGQDGADLNGTLQKQQTLMQQQDDKLHHIGHSVRGLKEVSALIANEIEDQTVLIDDLGEGMEHTETKMDGVMKKVAKVLHITNDRKQWMAICVLIIILFILVILFVVL